MLPKSLRFFLAVFVAAPTREQPEFYTKLVGCRASWPTTPITGLSAASRRKLPLSHEPPFLASPPPRSGN